MSVGYMPGPPAGMVSGAGLASLAPMQLSPFGGAPAPAAPPPTRPMILPNPPPVPLTERASSPSSAGLQDFYPADEGEHAKLLGWCLQAFLAADSERQPHYDRWRRYYKLYRSYIKRKQGDWRSRMFIPVVFWVIETIAPHLVASLPKFAANPMGPEDVEPAKLLEQLLDLCSQQSGLYVEMVKAVRSALKYGTGIMKTYCKQDLRRARRLVPAPATPIVAKREVPAIDPSTGGALSDADGNPLFDTIDVQMGSQPGEGMMWEPYEYAAYDGPAAEAVDIFNFWVAPEATDIADAPYVIQRVYRDWSFVERLFERGVYTLPPWMGLDEVRSLTVSAIESPRFERLSEVGLGAQTPFDPTRKPVEIMEYWTDDGRVITMLNRRVIVRCHENPYDHGMKPFVRIVDYLVEHEFYGIGEIEGLEGQQDLINALTNSRIDNVRLILNAMFAVNTKHLTDLSDLRWRPGGIVRVNDDMPARDVVHRIEVGDVTASAFEEANMTFSTIEKTSGVNAYTAGQDSPTLSPTATGVSLLQDAGVSRFDLKTRMFEKMGLRDLARQFSGLLLQFTDQPRLVRLLGPAGEIVFSQVTPESLQGSYDFDIEPTSTSATGMQRRQEALQLLQIGAPFVPWAIPKLFEDVLIAFDRKDVASYMPQQAPGGMGGIGAMGMPPMSPGGGAPSGGSPPGSGVPQAA